MPLRQRGMTMDEQLQSIDQLTTAAIDVGTKFAPKLLVAVLILVAGHYISIVKEEGEVRDITLSNTTLGHADLSLVVIPNRKIVGEILHNYGRIRQLGLEVGISYDSDVAGALEAIREVLRANPRVLKDPAPGVQVARLAESSIVVSIAPWVPAPDYGAAVGELNEAIVRMFRARNIALPAHELAADGTTAYLAAQRAGQRFASGDAA